MGKVFMSLEACSKDSYGVLAPPSPSHVLAMSYVLILP